MRKSIIEAYNEKTPIEKNSGFFAWIDKQKEAIAKGQIKNEAVLKEVKALTELSELPNESQLEQAYILGAGNAFLPTCYGCKKAKKACSNFEADSSTRWNTCTLCDTRLVPCVYEHKKRRGPALKPKPKPKSVKKQIKDQKRKKRYKKKKN